MKVRALPHLLGKVKQRDYNYYYPNDLGQVGVLFKGHGIPPSLLPFVKGILCTCRQ
jgi:hypothetical protein